MNFGDSHPVAIFIARTHARRVKRFLQNEYMRTAARFNPHLTKEVDTFNRWKKKAASIRIRRVIWSVPTPQLLGTMRKLQKGWSA